MVNPINQQAWGGRIDDEELVFSPRWHQLIQFVDLQDLNDTLVDKIVFVGFCSDQGVVRNKGRPGAKNGPEVIRQAMANLAVVNAFEAYDLGDVINENQLEHAQAELSTMLTDLIVLNAKPVVLGGGHEVGFASFKGAFDALMKSQHEFTLGVINFDAHLDCRKYGSEASSGTPFTQAALLSESFEKTFHYAVVGFNPTANTQGGVAFAKKRNTVIIDDVSSNLQNIEKIQSTLRDYLKPLSHVYLSLCLDVFHQSVAPGVSAPQAVGISPEFVITLLRWIIKFCKENNKLIVVFDIAEMNPLYDKEMITAKLAARLVHEYLNGS
ncbi:MAG: formimidoylglutamase [Cellvibrionales bacterium]|nr:formimidoylglutamase [Cellvibrionales bacterium]